MKRRRILLLLVLAAVATAAGLILFSPRGPKEPVVEGKRLSEWLAQAYPYYYDSASTDQALARKAVRAAGTNALPFFLHQFTVSESKIGSKFRSWLYSVSKGRVQLDPLRKPLAIGSYGIWLMGSNAAPALPTLAGYFDDARRAHYAIFAISECGDAALPYALKAVSSTNSQLAGQGVIALASIARKHESAIPPLLALLGHTNAGLQISAAANTGVLKNRPDLTVPALSNALFHTNASVKYYAARSLGDLGPAALPVVPELLRLTTNSSRDVAEEASNAVFRIDPSSLPPRGQ